MSSMGAIDPHGAAIPGRNGSRGLPYKIVTIISITGSMATVSDSFGRLQQINLNCQRAKGMKPVAGERWIADQALGGWSLAACIQGAPVIITGSKTPPGATGPAPALTNLLAALAAGGLIIDQTT